MARRFPRPPGLTDEEYEHLFGEDEEQEDRERFVREAGGPTLKTSRHDGREGSWPGKKRGRVYGEIPPESREV